MAAFFYAPGAIEHYVVYRNGSAAYLGTAVTAPEIEGRPFYLNVINDIGGRTAPMNKVGDRAQHVVTTTLNRYDQTVIDSILHPGAISNQTMINNTLNQGTLVFNTTLDFEFVFVYAAAAAGLTPSNFPIGRRYYQANVIGFKESTVGTRVKEVTLVVECNQIFIPATRNFLMYTENASAVTAGLPAVN